MGLWDKIAFITRSKANALMDSLEDPQEAINQTIADALVEYAKVKAAAAKVIAGETSAKNALAEDEKNVLTYSEYYQYEQLRKEAYENALAEYEKKHMQYEKAAENLCQRCRRYLQKMHFPVLISWPSGQQMRGQRQRLCPSWKNRFRISARTC